jgi:hypothetical protein
MDIRTITMTWKYSLRGTRHVLAERTMRFLLLENPLHPVPDPFLQPNEVLEAVANLMESSFLGYAATYWADHLLLAEDPDLPNLSRPGVMLGERALDDELSELAIRVCSMDSSGARHGHKYSFCSAVPSRSVRRPGLNLHPCGPWGATNSTAVCRHSMWPATCISIES